MARPATATVSKQTLDFERSLVLNRYFLATPGFERLAMLFKQLMEAD